LAQVLCLFLESLSQCRRLSRTDAAPPRGDLMPLRQLSAALWQPFLQQEQ